MKSDRQESILKIINSKNVETQEELTNMLRDEGFDVTQATVSRDIKQMKLIKILEAGGKYKYEAMSEGNAGTVENTFLSVFKQSYVSSDYAGNIIVIKTLPGMAPAAASVVDRMNVIEIVGTIAGDDTIMMVCRGEKTAADIIKKFSGLGGKDVTKA